MMEETFTDLKKAQVLLNYWMVDAVAPDEKEKAEQLVDFVLGGMTSELLRKIKSEEITTDEMVDILRDEGLSKAEVERISLEVMAELIGLSLEAIMAGWKTFQTETKKRRAVGQLTPITGLKSPRRGDKSGFDSNCYPLKVIPKLEAPKEFSYPRTAFGRRLRVSPETKQAWGELVAELSWDEWKDKAIAFFKLLNRDLWLCPHYHSTEYCKCGSKVLKNTPWGIHRHPPALSVRSLNVVGGIAYGRYGVDRRGHELVINIHQPIERRNKTLLHEVVHWIGNLGVEQAKNPEESSKYGAHTPAFWLRMKELGKQLGFEFKMESFEYPHQHGNI